MENTIKIFTRLSIFLILFLFLYYSYIGVTTQPGGGDSSDYHIPIARSVLNGSVFQPDDSTLGLLFYPGASNIILSFFILLQIPLNLFNVLAWVLFFIVLTQLAKGYGLDKYMAVIFAASICTMSAFTRGISTQSIDIWLTLFFSYALLLFHQPQKTLRYYLQLGICLGMIIGSKYSGPIYVVVLLCMYGRMVVKGITKKQISIFLVPIFILGISWYIRNAILTGSPLYPGDFFFLQGKDNFKLMDWQAWKTISLYPDGWIHFAQSILAEFGVWSMSLPVVLLLLVSIKRIPSQVFWLIVVGVINSIIYLFLPSWPENTLADLRYLYVAIVPLVLSVFLLAQSLRQEVNIAWISVLQMMLFLPQYTYYPKLACITLILFVVLHLRYERIKEV